MTTERTDHVNEAERHLRFMAENLRAEEFAFADLNAKEAQVHATLALVEQQRIATLAALAAAPQAGELGYLAALALCTPADPTVPGSKPQVRQETREVLGL